MKSLSLGSEEISLEFAKKLFRDHWGLTLGREEVAVLAYTWLRTKATGKNAEGSYSLKKKGRDSYEIIRNGTTLATYKGRKEGVLTFSGGKVFNVTHTEELSLPGSTMLYLAQEGSDPIAKAGTNWNLVGLTKSEVVIEPNSLTGDDLWAAIFLLAHHVVTYGLWKVPIEIGASINIAGRVLR